MKFKIAIVLAAVAGLAPAASASHGIIITEEDGAVCTLTTFEGGGHLNQIHPETGGLVPGTPIRFGSEWLTITSGAYANNPSVPTIAVFLSNTAQVTFDQPVARVSFFFASISGVSIQALDSSGTVVSSASGAANFDPATGFTVWEELGVDAGTNVITSVTVTGAGFGTGIDDFTACQEDFELIEAEIDLHPDNYPNETDPYNTNSNKPVDLGVLSTADFDATTIDVGTALLGDPALAGTVAAQSYWTKDLNGDGLPDLIINFGAARDFDEAGALDANSVEVELTALTLSGNFVMGVDAVTIVGN